MKCKRQLVSDMILGDNEYICVYLGLYKLLKSQEINNLDIYIERIYIDAMKPNYKKRICFCKYLQTTYYVNMW